MGAGRGPAPKSLLDIAKETRKKADSSKSAPQAASATLKAGKTSPNDDLLAVALAERQKALATQKPAAYASNGNGSSSNRNGSRKVLPAVLVDFSAPLTPLLLLPCSKFHTLTRKCVVYARHTVSCAAKMRSTML